MRALSTAFLCIGARHRLNERLKGATGDEAVRINEQLTELQDYMASDPAASARLGPGIRTLCMEVLDPKGS